MTRRYGGMDFDITVGTDLIHVESITLEVTDNTAVAQTRGVPDGWIKGDVSAEGEIEVDEQNFNKLNAQAAAAGSWRALEPVDILFYASGGAVTSRIEAFGCKLMLSSVYGADPKGGTKATRTVKYIVTDPEFVHVGGTHYLDSDDLNGIVG
ncbi:phage protein [Klebsiella michiganensis]|uniref:phage protein n=1 Tax=Klebsiella michiganensis TaxID=1134687 RepID=UPI001F15329E|nr:phage protein [Klebsiella michiganensis]